MKRRHTEAKGNHGGKAPMEQKGPTAVKEHTRGILRKVFQLRQNGCRHYT